MGNDPLFINKIAAAVLSAGLLAMLAGFIAQQVYHPHVPEKPAYTIAEGVTPAETQTASAPAGPEPIAPLLANASVENGEKVAKKCTSCHTFEKGGPNKIGPNLWNVVGARKAHMEGFAYSGAMQGAEGNWDYEALNHFLYKPRDYLSGTKMTFAGLKKGEDRADIIMYLRSMSENPPPLPQ